MKYHSRVGDTRQFRHSTQKSRVERHPKVTHLATICDVTLDSGPYSNPCCVTAEQVGLWRDGLDHVSIGELELKELKNCQTQIEE